MLINTIVAVSLSAIAAAIAVFVTDSGNNLQWPGARLEMIIFNTILGFQLCLLFFLTVNNSVRNIGIACLVIQFIALTFGIFKNWNYQNPPLHHVGLAPFRHIVFLGGVFIAFANISTLIMVVFDRFTKKA